MTKTLNQSGVSDGTGPTPASQLGALLPRQRWKWSEETDERHQPSRWRRRTSLKATDGAQEERRACHQACVRPKRSRALPLLY